MGTWWARTLVRACYGAWAVLFAAWVAGPKLGGLAPDSAGAVNFNWHPTLMGAAWVVAVPEALLAWRAPGPATHTSRKLTHGLLHAAALALAAAGAAVIFANHATHGFAHLRSAHSWLGAATTAAFLAQAGLATYAFAVKAVSEGARRRMLPAHRAAGLATAMLGLAAVALGLAEKQGFVECEGDELCAAKAVPGAMVLLTATQAAALAAAAWPEAGAGAGGEAAPRGLSEGLLGAGGCGDGPP
mmetsp:Transcript_20246/g.68903  ORF Transcript_20246/g.68903 Transcript_20246/m.68903 type:complete len:244 (+) Transcript_20246:35-766(+)